MSVYAKNCVGNSSTVSKTIKGVGAPGQPGSINGKTSVCIGTQYNYSVTNAGGLTYTWTIAPTGYTIVNGQGTHNINVVFQAPPNTYTISVYTTNACGSSAPSTLTVTSKNCRLGDDASSVSSVIAYPNPVKDLLNVNFSSTEEQRYNVKLMDMTGRVVSSEANTSTVGVNHLELNVKGLASGVYMLNFQMGDANEKIRVVVE